MARPVHRWRYLTELGGVSQAMLLIHIQISLCYSIWVWNLTCSRLWISLLMPTVGIFWLFVVMLPTFPGTLNDRSLIHYFFLRLVRSSEQTRVHCHRKWQQPYHKCPTGEEAGYVIRKKWSGTLDLLTTSKPLMWTSLLQPSSRWKQMNEWMCEYLFTHKTYLIFLFFFKSLINYRLHFSHRHWCHHLHPHHHTNSVARYNFIPCFRNMFVQSTDLFHPLISLQNCNYTFERVSLFFKHVTIEKHKMVQYGMFFL